MQSLHRWSSQSRQSRPPDTRVDINLTTARPPVDTLYRDYAASPSLSTLNPLLSALQVHQHVYQLSQHLRSKLAWASPSALLFFSSPRSSPASSSASPPLPDAEQARSTLSVAAVSVSSLDGELLSERIVKTFHCHLSPTQFPTSSPSSPSPSPPPPVVVETDWRTERNKMRGMGVHSYSMRVLVHVPLQLTAEFPAVVASAASTLLSPDYASYVLVDGYDSDEGRVGVGRGQEGLAAGGLLDVLPVLMQMGRLSRDEFVWLLSVLCTFPSDVAFDVLSDRLTRLKHVA